MEHLSRDDIGAGPDAYGKQHDVHHAEAGDGQRPEQQPGFRIVASQRIFRRALRLEAQLVEFLDDQVVAERWRMADGDPLGGKIHPHGGNARHRGEATLDLADAPGAFDARHGKAAVFRRYGSVFVNGRKGVHCSASS